MATMTPTPTSTAPAPGFFPWLWSGALRFRWGALAALVSAWTGLWLALWAVVFGVVAGGVVGVAEAIGHAVDPSTFGTGPTEGLTIAGAALGAAAGGLATIAYFVGASLLLYPLLLVLQLVSGAVFGGVLTALAAFAEQPLLELRGIREMAQSERARIAPLMVRVGTAMGVDEARLPTVLVKPTKTPGAWTHCRHIVVSEGLLASIPPAQDDQLAWVLAHELHHWRSGDGVGLRFVWACALPVALLYNLGVLLAGGTPGDPERTRPTHPLLTTLAWIILWPTAVLSRYVIGPVTAWNSWPIEYAADQAAADAVSREAGLKVLDQLRSFEPGRSGFEAMLAQTHPPIPYRKDRLQPGWEPSAPSPRPFLQRHPRYVITAVGIVVVLGGLPAHANSSEPAVAVCSTCVAPGPLPGPTDAPVPTPSPTPYVDGQLVTGYTNYVGGMPVDYPDTPAGVAEHATNDAILLGQATDTSTLLNDLAIITSSTTQANAIEAAMAPLLQHDEAAHPNASFVSEQVVPQAYRVTDFSSTGATVVVQLWATVTVVSSSTTVGGPQQVAMTLDYQWQAPDWRLLSYSRTATLAIPRDANPEPPSS